MIYFICAWCGKDILGKKASVQESHGICWPCIDDYFPEVADEMRKGRMINEETADDLLDERKFQEHMEEQGARQIGICLYEEQPTNGG